MARPTKFKPAEGEKICALLSQGMFLSDAADFVGVDPRTVERWIERGSAGREPYKQFAADAKKARAQYVLLTLRKIEEAGDRDATKALRWRLEKLRPRQFGDRVQVHVTREHEEALARFKEAFASEPALLERVISVLAAESSAPGVGEDP